jgi:hypothetical protein
MVDEWSYLVRPLWWANDDRFGTMVLQGGNRQDPDHMYSTWPVRSRQLRWC